MQYADNFLSADQCVVSVPKIWYLPGGSTRTGTITELRLFNPFADTAEVTATAMSLPIRVGIAANKLAARIVRTVSSLRTMS